MTLFSYLWRMVHALLLRYLRHNALWLTPRSRATVFYESSRKRQEKLLLLQLQWTLQRKIKQTLILYQNKGNENEEKEKSEGTLH